MTKFIFSADNPAQQYVKIKVTFDTPNSETKIQLPAWRPGRYELANFAKYIRNFKVVNGKGRQIDAPKSTKDQWVVDTSEYDSIEVQYSFYANILNAGSTFLDENQLYVNPVNCCVYTEESFLNEIAIELETKDPDLIKMG